MGRRKNGQGLIRQRKDGRWEGRCVIGYDEKGLPITKNVLAKTKRETEEKLKALRESVEKPVVKTSADMSFGEYIELVSQLLRDLDRRDNETQIPKRDL